MAARLQPDAGQPAAQVLVVEDYPDTSVFVRQALEHAGLQVTVAATGERALELAALEPFDLILLDLSSPGIRALEVCRELRQEPATRETPLMFLAGWETSLAVADEVRQFGAAEVIIKPFQTLDFLTRVLRRLRQQTRATADVLDSVWNR